MLPRRFQGPVSLISMISALHRRSIAINRCSPHACRTPLRVGPYPRRLAQLVEQIPSHERKASVCRSTAEDDGPATPVPSSLVGEDAAVFSVERQSLTSWGLFLGLLTGVLGLIYLASLWNCAMRRCIMQCSHSCSHACRMPM